MGYVITNDKIYIRLSESGSPKTVSKRDAQIFDKEKAENIFKNLPKVLKNFHLHIKNVPEEVESNKKYIVKEDYMPCEEAIRWVERAEECGNFVNEVLSRKNILFKKLSNIDRELSNCMHEIELSKWKSGCEGYKEYKSIKDILERRRKIKDELAIVQSISDSAKCSVDIKNIKKAFNRLSRRKFEIRIIEDGFDDTDNTNN